MNFEAAALGKQKSAYRCACSRLHSPSLPKGTGNTPVQHSCASGSGGSRSLYISCVGRSESVNASLQRFLFPVHHHVPRSPGLIAAPAGLQLSESVVRKRSPRTGPGFRISDDHGIFAVAIQFLSDADWQPFRLLVGYRVQRRDAAHDRGQQFSNDRHHYILDDLWSWQL